MNPQLIATGERSQLISQYRQARAHWLEWLRRKIIDENRVDLLATEVLGYTLKPFHRYMLQWQFWHPDNLQLVFRGAGKSTICTVTKSIWYLIKFPKARIVIGGKIIKQARARLKEIRSHLEGNELLIELFGTFVRRDVWNATEIEIAQRFDPKNRHSPGAAATDATPSIACVGAKGSIAGAHFDIEFSDDLIDQSNSHTELTREEVNEWYNATFTPMLDPPDPDIPFRFHRHRVGTRYHYLDQYGRWIKQAIGDYKAGIPAHERMWINVIPGYDYRDTRGHELHNLGLGVYSGTGSGCSPWPERWPVEELLKRKRQIGRIAFEAQYLNDIDAMSGEIFDYEDFVEISELEAKKLYPQMKFYIGCDLAISQKTTADDSAFVVVGKHGRGADADYYVVDVDGGKLRFKDQTAAIKRLHDKWDSVGAGVIRIGVEAVQYQQAQYQKLEEISTLRGKLRRVVPRKGDDKISRAHRRTPIVEGRHVKLVYHDVNVDGRIERVIPGWRVREQSVLMPNGDHDDYFDGFDHAITVSTRGGKKKREKELGLL